MRRFSRPTTTDRRGSITLLTLWWVGVTVVGSGAMVAHTRHTLTTSCADAIADAIVLAHVGHGEGGAHRLASRLEARVVETVIGDDDTTQMTVESPCGTATSAAIVG